MYSVVLYIVWIGNYKVTQLAVHQEASSHSFLTMAVHISL